MFRGIRRLAEMNRRTSKGEERRDGEGNVLVELTINDDSGLLSPYSYGRPTLSEEAAAFLDGSLRPKYYKENVRLTIHSDVIDESEKPVYEAAIRNHYEKTYEKKRQLMGRELVIAVFMLLAGAALLSLMIILDRFVQSAVALEVLDIVAWVFLWEAADIFFLQFTAHRMEQMKNAAFFNSVISFEALQAQNTCQTMAKRV